MNTSELLELAEFALVCANNELRDNHKARSEWTRGFLRAQTIDTVTRALEAMRKTAAAVPVVLALAFGAGQAKAADQSAAIAKAEQAVVLATCKLNFLQQRPGAKKNDKEYFGFMFQCMSK